MANSLRLKIQQKIKKIDKVDLNINNSFPDLKNISDRNHHKVKVTTIYINIDNYQNLIQKLKEKEKLKFVNLYLESILKILNYYQISNFNFFGTEIYGFINHNKNSNFEEGNLLTAAIEINSFLSNFAFKINYKIILSTGIDLLSIIEINKRKKTIALVNGTIYRAKDIFAKTKKSNLIYLNELYEKNNSNWLQKIPKSPCSYPIKIDAKNLNEKIFALNCIFSDWKMKN